MAISMDMHGVYWLVEALITSFYAFRERVAFVILSAIAVT